MWVERRNGSTAIHQLSGNEAYWLLEDMVDFNYRSWRYLPSHLGLGDNSNTSAPWCDTQHHQAEPSPNLEYLFAQFLEQTKLCHEEWERRETILNLQIESLYNSLKAMRRTMAMIHAQIIKIDKSHHEKSSISRRIFGLFDNDDSTE
ncbi:hypothetical protein TorRG33x02_118370 [Trema orientale]|uniref:Uncharacterized protein n=1 Tax=Trema orientale TaxID=63057 RepID=A0A2P5F3J3_TREOI|nr:hypothetical protein TorRG33x02_118370 [Trema orientale]